MLMIDQERKEEYMITSTASGLKWLLLGGLLGGVMTCLVGCGTARGLIDGVSAIGGGIVQDVRGAVDGITQADQHNTPDGKEE